MKERMEERMRLLSPKVPSSLCQVGGGRGHYYEPKNVKFLVRNLDLTCCFGNGGTWLFNSWSVLDFTFGDLRLILELDWKYCHFHFPIKSYKYQINVVNICHLSSKIDYVVSISLCIMTLEDLHFILAKMVLKNSFFLLYLRVKTIKLLWTKGKVFHC